MTIRLRGHHLLCLLGFRGMGYSAAYAANMARVYNRLKDEPHTPVTIVAGPDELCACFPADEEPHCENASVARLDRDALAKLDLRFGLTLPWSAVIARVRAGVEPEDIGTLCRTCQWRSYGVCEAGVRTIKEGGRLPPLPE
ncbi:hypothetical protein SAMN02799624_00077 [Paenibacillus sp. UNC496MF]|uniref:DUF1284 domain-containing protein n=1 Tax=Paenibacillus sp. UNC496MF TaxID=1502753 RepID=UPI0008E901C2|nr:DUF1284 domain-containing protein [Paenibacillus sp. UNC496MF]SFI27939.1 hypothetical protein SAMN02799624_00077 [Paenibacillus sp. UNC496MF]